MVLNRGLKVAVVGVVLTALSLIWSVLIVVPGCGGKEPPEPPPKPDICLFFCDSDGTPRTDVPVLSPVGKAEHYPNDGNGRVFLPRRLIGARVSIRDSSTRELGTVTVEDKGPEAQRIELP